MNLVNSSKLILACLGLRSRWCLGRLPCKEGCFLPMNNIQAIESFNQYHAYKASFVQIVDHQTHPLIYSICFIHQEIPRKEPYTEGVEIVRLSPTSQRNGQLKEVCKKTMRMFTWSSIHHSRDIAKEIPKRS